MTLFDVQTLVGRSWAAELSADLPALDRVLSDAGIDEFAVSSWAALAAGEIDAGNRGLLASLERLGRGYLWLGLNPMFWDASLTLLRDLAAHRRVVGVRLHPVVGRYTLDEFATLRLLGEIDGLGLPVLMHVENGGGSAGSRAVRTVAERFPETRFIAAHLGVSENFHSGIDAVLSCSSGNLWLETSGLELLYTGYLAFTVREVGPDRVLFGSGAPLIEPSVMVRMLELAELDDRARTLIAGANAERLLLGPRRVTVEPPPDGYAS